MLDVETASWLRDDIRNNLMKFKLTKLPDNLFKLAFTPPVSAAWAAASARRDGRTLCPKHSATVLSYFPVSWSKNQLISPKFYRQCCASCDLLFIIQADAEKLPPQPLQCSSPSPSLNLIIRPAPHLRSVKVQVNFFRCQF